MSLRIPRWYLPQLFVFPRRRVTDVPVNEGRRFRWIPRGTTIPGKRKQKEREENSGNNVSERWLPVLSRGGRFNRGGKKNRAKRRLVDGKYDDVSEATGNGLTSSCCWLIKSIARRDRDHLFSDRARRVIWLLRSFRVGSQSATGFNIRRNPWEEREGARIRGRMNGLRVRPGFDVS